MLEASFPHHKVILQSLYSTRSNWKYALRHSYSIAQARSDVFFALLFGGQICVSAGAFFDSPIAIRIFGELFSHEKFKDYCKNYGWRPLWLNTDRLTNSSDIPSPIDFITTRWLNQNMSFTFFRESEPKFDDKNEIFNLKEDVCKALKNGQFGSLTDALEPLFTEHKIINYNAEKEFALTPAILTEDTGSWLEKITSYLIEFNAFENRDSTKNPKKLDEFFPLQAIIERTNNLDGSSNEYSKEELIKINNELLKKLGQITTANPIHIEGPKYYGYAYPLIDYWMESEWHTVRQRVYGAETCILSSDWQMRDVFDVDKTSMATYVSDARIDDSLRKNQEHYGELHWDVLFSVISDKIWRDKIRELRGCSKEKKSQICDDILKLLAKKLTSFSFDHDEGLVTITAKTVTNIGTKLAYLGIVSQYHNTFSGLLGEPLAHSLEVSVAWTTPMISKTQDTIKLLHPFVKGAKYLHSRFQERQLRRAILTDIYSDNN